MNQSGGPLYLLLMLARRAGKRMECGDSLMPTIPSPWLTAADWIITAAIIVSLAAVGIALFWSLPETGWGLVFMGTASIVFFFFGLLLEWYENKVIVLGISQRPMIVATPLRQVALLLIRLLAIYGGLAGLFFLFGAAWALGAFATYWVFSGVTFRRSYNEQVRHVAKELMSADEGLAHEPPFVDDGDSDRLTESEALEEARRIVESNYMMAGGPATRLRFAGIKGGHHLGHHSGKKA